MNWMVLNPLGILHRDFIWGGKTQELKVYLLVAAHKKGRWKKENWIFLSWVTLHLASSPAPVMSHSLYDVRNSRFQVCIEDQWLCRNSLGAQWQIGTSRRLSFMVLLSSCPLWSKTVIFGLARSHFLNLSNRYSFNQFYSSIELWLMKHSSM